MNYEALGKYTHLKQMRQDLRLKLHTLAQAPLRLAHSLENYAPPYAGTDSVPQEIATLEAVLPDIKEAVARMNDLWAEMAALREKYNLPT